MDSVLATLRVELLEARRSVLGAAWRRSGGIDPYGRLYYIESGRAFVHHHGRRFDMVPRRLYLIPADTDLALGCPRRVVIRWCHFAATVLGGIDLFAYLACAYELAPRDATRIAGLFARLVELHAGHPDGWELDERGVLLQILAPLVATAAGSARERSRARVLTFRPALEHLDRHIERPIRVSELAATVGFQPAYFTRLFTRAFGVGPAAYVLRKKIEVAQRLMVETDGTLEFIAGRLGFSDAFHLSKTFKRLVGATPSEFRAGRTVRQP